MNLAPAKSNKRGNPIFDFIKVKNKITEAILY